MAERETEASLRSKLRVQGPEFDAREFDRLTKAYATRRSEKPLMRLARKLLNF